MPASGSMFVQEVTFFMAVFTLLVGAAVRLANRPAAPVMCAVGVVLCCCLPFLFFWRTAIYHDSPAYGDASLGWPLIYAYAESDAGLSSFRASAFWIDFTPGSVIGTIYLVIRRRYARTKVA